VKYLLAIICMVIPAAAIAAGNPAEITFNQYLSAVDYFRDGKQSGCGLRATAETKADVWLNVLITVFLKHSGVTMGVAKVVARKANIQSGTSDKPEQSITFSSIGKIQKAWIEPSSGERLPNYRSGQSSHSDGYMTPMEFAATTKLLAEMSREDFRVGINLDEDQPDKVFAFDQRPDQIEINKLSACMHNLRNEIELNQRHQVF